MVYASLFTLGRNPDFCVELAEDLMRLGAERFMEVVLERFRGGIWTSATAEYVGDVIFRLIDDPGKLAFIRTREYCVKQDDERSQDRFWVKDLGQLLVLGYKPNPLLS